jgi:thiol-disulfide isomerase/thioredoxin
MQELTADNLKEVLEQNEKVVVQYGAGWCGACRIIKPKFKALSDENSDIAFYYVDAEKFPESRALANVQNLPTFAGFVKGQVVKEGPSAKIEFVQGIVDEVTNN